MRIPMTVTDEDTRPTLLGIDPAAPGYGTHLPFFLILQRCGLAWRHFLVALEGFEDSIIVPHLTADFVAEVHAGEIEVAVEVVKLGTTSFTLRCTVLQADAVTARIEVVLVCFDYEGGTPVPLTVHQREQLESARD